MSEKELVQRAQSGDFEAFSELIELHKATIYALARRLAGNSEDADDIVQDTFLKAIDKIDQFQLKSSFGTWLYAIALNQARAMFTKRKQADLREIDDYIDTAKKGGHVSSTDGLHEWQNPHDLLEEEELRDVLDQAIAELPYMYREAFVLRYLEELPVKEVARTIGETEAATKSRILRARLALREKLAGVFEGNHG